MKSVNKVFITGNIGKDPEIRTMQSGDQTASFSVAVNDGYKKDGEWVDKTTWVNVAVFNPHLIKFAENNLKKGSKVLIDGKLSIRNYTDKNGVDKQATEVVLEKFGGEIHLLDSKKEPSAHDQAKANGYVPETEDDESIPF